MSESNNEDPLTPEAAPESVPVKKAKLNRLILIIAPVVITVLVGLYLFFFIFKSSKHEKTEELQEKDKQQANLAQVSYLDLEPVTISLTPSGSKVEYLRINITLKLASEKENQAVSAMIPMIKDAIITFLKSLRSTDFQSSSSTLYLKEELAKRINKITAPIVIKEVLLQELTIN